MIKEYDLGLTAVSQHKALIRETFPLILYLMLSPFYFFSSGLPQIADFVLVIGVALNMMRKRGFSFPNSWFTRILFLFLINTSLVNLLTAFFLQTTRPLLPALYYLYNSLVVFFVLNLYFTYGRVILRFIFWSISVSSLTQFALIIARMDYMRTRQVGFFNNPNQLGYYSLINLAIIAVTSREVRTSRSFLAIVIIINIFLAMLSNSKAAVISGVVIIAPMLLRFFAKKRVKKTRLNLFIALLPIVLIVLMLYGSSIVSFTGSVYRNTQRRLSAIGMDSDDDITGRGYGRIVLYPEFILYGAAEGIGPLNDPRYDDPFMSGELHSTFGTLLFSYGFIGLSAFLMLLVIATDFGSLISISAIGAISLYSLTHQGLRFTSVWILIGVLFIMKNSKKQSVQ